MGGEEFVYVLVGNGLSSFLLVQHELLEDLYQDFFDLAGQHLA